MPYSISRRGRFRPGAAEQGALEHRHHERRDAIVVHVRMARDRGFAQPTKHGKEHRSGYVGRETVWEANVGHHRPRRIVERLLSSANRVAWQCMRRISVVPGADHSTVIAMESRVPTEPLVQRISLCARATHRLELICEASTLHHRPVGELGEYREL